MLVSLRSLYEAAGGVNATGAPAGVVGIASQGTVTATGTATATPAGVQGTAAVGTATASGGANASPSGVQATGAVGTPTASGGTVVNATATPAGVAGTGSVGTPAGAGSGTTSTTGQDGTGQVGQPSASGAANVVTFGQEAQAQVGQATAIGGPVDATAFTDGVEGQAQVGDAIGSTGGWDNQTGGLRIYNLKRRKKRPAEPVPDGRWDITVSGPQVVEVSTPETPPIESVVVVARDHSRWITVPAPKPLRVKARVVAVKSVENDEEHALRLLLLLAS